MLTGLIIDVWIAYLIKQIMRLKRTWGSAKWNRVNVKIDYSRVGGGWTWNCPTAEVAYTFQFEGQTISATDSKPFLSETIAKAWADQFMPGKTAIARVNPVEPQKSVLVYEALS